MENLSVSVTVYPSFASPLQLKLMQSFSQDGSAQFYVVGRYIGVDIETGGYYWLGDVPKDSVFKRHVSCKDVKEIYTLCRKLDSSIEYKLLPILHGVTYELEYVDGNNVYKYKWPDIEPKNHKILYSILNKMSHYMRVSLPG